MSRTHTQRPRTAGWPLRITLAYAAIGALWILYSDRPLALLADSVTELSWLQTYKGWLFIAVTAALLYVLCSRFARMPADAPAPRLASDRRMRRLILLVLAIFIGTVLVNFAWSLQAARKDSLAEAHQSARNLTLALERHTASTIDSVELALKAIDLRLTMTAPRTGPESIDAQMQEALDNLPFVRAIWVLDADGDMVHDSEHLPGKYNLADRVYFRVQRDRHSRKQVSSELYVDEPTLSKHGVWFIPLSRRVEDPNGRFAGVVVAALEPRHLEAFYDSLDVGTEGVVALLRTDGVVMHRSPPLRDQQLTPSRLDARVAALISRGQSGGFEATSQLDGTDRLYAYRRLPGRPLVVAVGLGKRESLVDWRETVSTYAFGSLALLLLIGGLGYWLLRELAQRRVQELRIDRLHRVQAVLSGVNALIVRARQRSELFDESCRIAVHQGRFGVAWIDAYDGDTGVIQPCAAAGPDAAHIVPDDRPAQAHDSAHWGIVAQAIADRRSVHSNDLATMPGHRSERRLRALERGYRSAVALPLLSDDKVVAVLAMMSKEKGFFDADELSLLDELAGDVSFALDHIAAQEHIDYLALYDVLTGLPNRVLFAERLEQILQQARRQGSLCGVVKVDIERFRSINDTLGWAGGDALLRQVATRLQEALGEHGLLARVERDRFVFAIDLQGDAAELANETRRILRDVFEPAFRVSDHDLRVAARVGIAVFPGDGDDPATLLRNAETALARSKDSPERFLFYAREMNARVAESLALENRLRSALEGDQFELHYQPKFAAGTGALTGLEGLLRWRDPEDGLVPPIEFIPVLEETGLIRDVGKWTLQQAIRDYRRWRDAGLPAPRIAVNVSATQLHETVFTTLVQEAVANAGSRDHGLDIELTESTLMAHVETNAARLAALRGLGIRIAIDDFGTGYSSLQYIARLPLDTLKIDRSFVTGMIDSASDRAIVSSVISLAHELGLTVVAEGVETQAQADALRALDCDEMQGYLFSPPVPAAQVEAWLHGGFPSR